MQNGNFASVSVKTLQQTLNFDFNPRSLANLEYETIPPSSLVTFLNPISCSKYAAICSKQHNKQQQRDI